MARLMLSIGLPARYSGLLASRSKRAEMTASVLITAAMSAAVDSGHSTTWRVCKAISGSMGSSSRL